MFFVLLGAHEDLLLTADDLAEIDDTVNLGNDRRIVRATSLKQLGYSRQTTGNIAGLGHDARHLDQVAAGLHRVAILNLELRIDRNAVRGDHLAALAHNLERREQVLFLGFDDD